MITKQNAITKNVQYCILTSLIIVLVACGDNISKKTETEKPEDKEQTAESSSFLSVNNGWKDVKWGMTVAEVSALYPEAIKISKPGYMVNGVECTNLLIIADYKIFDFFFSVNFLFDSESLLAGVNLSFPQDGVAVNKYQKEYRDLDREYKYIKDSLTENYGAPELFKSSGDYDSCHWSVNNTKIKLNLITISTLWTMNISFSK